MPLRLHAGAVVTPPGAPYEPNQTVLRYHRDLVELFGGKLDEDLLRAGGQASHTLMADLLVGRLAAEDVRPDLVVLAAALPDLNPVRSVSAYLGLLTGGRADQCFSVTEQGLGAAFTALRIGAAHERTGASSAFLLAVLEQTTLPAHDPVVHDGVPLRDSGVLLLFDSGTGFGEVSSVARLRDAALLGPRLTALTAGAPRPLVVAGPWTDPAALPSGVDCHRVPPGSYCTSVWTALAEHWTRWREEYDTLVLCDTDPRSDTAHVAVLGRGR
ncbi:hypothetical protein [Streptomyces sp. DSM 15324]|uniref:hypothetical protein n=1 Tax=Streptomyces sp. DSM 15324 TaxID=1739111 RepID=UPI000748035C|nr:hypothetical protein [Streptomyces sp. DSM 15324]KUO13107.1 hypothetical protein AQJ58_04260 [Streptomyces sp. DSM 15324]